MKFITEFYDDPLSLIVESNKSTGKKELFFEGAFAVAGVKNKNGRQYDKELLSEAIKKYETDYIKNNRALGEMNHPPRLNIDFERATHLITEMRHDGNGVWVGKAKVLETPMGSILKGLLESGVNVGVSTRGAGSISEENGIKKVGKDYFLTAVDVVSDPSGITPSGAGCFIKTVMEGYEYDIDDSGKVLIENIAVIAKKDYDKKALTEQRKLELFTNFIKAMK